MKQYYYIIVEYEMMNKDEERIKYQLDMIIKRKKNKRDARNRKNQRNNTRKTNE